MKVLLLFVKKSGKRKQDIFPGSSTNSRAVDFVDRISPNSLSVDSPCTVSYIPGCEVLSDVSSWPVTFITTGELRPHPIKLKPQEGWKSGILTVLFVKIYSGYLTPLHSV